MIFPVKDNAGTEYTKEQYEALTAEEKRAKGFYTDEDLVYETVVDELPNLGKNFIGSTKSASTYVPVSTMINGCSDFNGVYFEGIEEVGESTPKMSVKLTASVSGSATAESGGTFTITPTATVSNGDGATVAYTYECSTAGITVADGAVTVASTVAAGTYTITVKATATLAADEDAGTEAQTATAATTVKITVAAVTHTIALALDKTSLTSDGGTVTATVTYDGVSCTDATITCSGATVSGYTVTIPANTKTSAVTYTVTAAKGGKTASKTVTVAAKAAVTTKYLLGTMSKATYGDFEDDDSVADLTTFMADETYTSIANDASLPYEKELAIDATSAVPFAITKDTTKDVNIQYYSPLTSGYEDYTVQSKTFELADGTYKIFMATPNASGTLKIKFSEK